MSAISLGGRAVSTALKNNPADYSSIVQQTQHAIQVAQEAAAASAHGIATASVQQLRTVRAREEQLDTLDREINEAVTAAIVHVQDEAQGRELLACLKFILDLERIGDLLLSFANRAEAVAARIEPEDVKNLTTMASILESMLGDAYVAFAGRDLDRAVRVLRADSELDRLRNLMFVRHVENPEGVPRQESFHIVFMTQMLERCGDHTKNLAEEVAHLVTGRSIRHLLRSYDKPWENMFVEWMRKREGNKH